MMGDFEHQHQPELNWLLERIAGARSILEIGSAQGHTLSLMAMAAANGARIVSIDAGLAQGTLAETIGKLSAAGYAARGFVGDSHSGAAIRFARENGPYDFIFIDGDHDYDGVAADWNNYGFLGRMVGFHDIAHPHHDVSRLWQGIKNDGYKTEECVLSTMGIGIVHR